MKEGWGDSVNDCDYRTKRLGLKAGAVRYRRRWHYARRTRAIDYHPRPDMPNSSPRMGGLGEPPVNDVFDIGARYIFNDFS